MSVPASPAKGSFAGERGGPEVAQQAHRSMLVALWVLAIIALLVRVGLVMARGQLDASTTMEHSSLATSLLAGNGFAFNEADGYTPHGLYEPSSVQSPPYPLLLAGLYWLFGVRSETAHLVAQLINAFAGAATVPLLYFATRRVGGTRAVALLSAALVAIWPTQIFAVAWAQAITLITLCTVAIVALWYRSIDTGSLGSWLAFGVVGCLAALTEPVLLPPMALAGVMIFLHPRLPWTLRLRNAAVLLGCALVIFGPWTYRNWRVHGAIMPVKSTFWVNVWKGNNPHSAGTDRPALTDEQLARFRQEGRDDVRQYDMLSREQRAELDGKRAVEREAIWKRYASDYISNNPGRYLQLCGLRFAKTIWVEWDNPKSYDRLYIYFASRTLLLIGTIAGLVLALRRRWRLGWPAVIFGLSLLTYTLTITAARFAFPLEPLQIALLSLALVCGWRAVRGRPMDIEERTLC